MTAGRACGSTIKCDPYAAEATMPDIDGAWWKEKLDPDGFSAPRGVIFKSRLDKWIAQPTDYDWGDDDPDE